MARDTLKMMREYSYIQKSFEKEAKRMRAVNRKRKAKGWSPFYKDVSAQAYLKLEPKYNIYKSTRCLDYIIGREYLKNKIDADGNQLPEEIGKGINQEHLAKVIEAKKNESNKSK